MSGCVRSQERGREKSEILDNCDHADEKMFAKENIQKGILTLQISVCKKS